MGTSLTFAKFTVVGYMVPPPHIREMEPHCDFLFSFSIYISRMIWTELLHLKIDLGFSRCLDRSRSPGGGSSRLAPPPLAYDKRLPVY